MKYIEDYLKDVIKVKPLGELTTMDDELNGISGEMVYINGKCSDIFITYADYANWIERRRQKPKKFSIWKHWKDGIAGNGEGKPIFLIKIGNRYNLSSCLSTKCDYIELSELDNLVLEKQFEQKSFDYESANIQQKDFAPKQEPKFKVSEWIIWYGNCYKIYYNECGYELIDQNGLSTSLEYTTVDENAHLWTIKDAKDGDILSTKSGRPFVFKDFSDVKHPNNPTAYCGIDYSNKFKCSDYDYFWWTHEEVFPATKKQRDTLMIAMNKAGYEWDTENKELRKIEQPKLTAFEEAIKEMMEDYRDAIYSPDAVTEKEVKNYSKYLLSLIPHKPVEWTEDDKKMFGSIRSTLSMYMNNFSLPKEIRDIHKEELKWLDELYDRGLS